MKISANYQPQSRDTHPEVDKFLMQSFRRMSTCKKASLFNEATRGTWQCSLIGIRNQYPNITPEKIQFQLAIRWLGKEVAEKILIHNRGQLVEANIIELALKMVDVFDLLKIPYLIGGSVASSILGEPRATLDVGIVADL